MSKAWISKLIRNSDPQHNFTLSYNKKNPPFLQEKNRMIEQLPFIIEFWNLFKNTFIIREFARLLLIIRIWRCWSKHFYPYNYKNYVHGGIVCVCVSCACAY